MWGKTKKTRNVVNYVGLNFGADPELFLSKNGKIIGSEKVIPEGGVTWTSNPGIVAVIRDGVQVEFNVPANSCRQSFSNNLGECFRILAGTLSGGVKADFRQTVEVDPEEMKSLHPSSQQFGCAPSENAYGKEEIAISDASQYFYRSAGGHLHLGMAPAFMGDPNRLAMVLDVVLGNTCVLLDRDLGNIERRKVYGKAGEYRLPKHGFEYRVLSNFWLRSYQVMSFVTGMARFGVSINCNDGVASQLLKLVDIDKVRYAINNNDYDVALENFNDIKDFLQNTVGHVPTGRDYDPGHDAVYPLEGTRMEGFLHFVAKGLDHWFKEDIMSHWVGHNYANRHGWETFIDYDVHNDMFPPKKVEAQPETLRTKLGMFTHSV